MQASLGDSCFWIFRHECCHDIVIGRVYVGFRLWKALFTAVVVFQREAIVKASDTSDQRRIERESPAMFPPQSSWVP